MQLFVRWVFVCAAFVVSLRADRLNPTAPPDTTTKEAASRPKPKRLRWLRKIGSAEVGLAMKLSAIGIERSVAPATAPGTAPMPAPAAAAAGL